MKRMDARGRVIDPFGLYERTAKKALKAVEEFSNGTRRGSKVIVVHADAISIARRIRRPVDVVITSPPYHNAVDYYRRHQLEMFWLGMTKSHADRLALLPKYIGRSRVPRTHPFLAEERNLGALAATWETQMRTVSRERADAFRHYVVSMSNVLQQLATVLQQDGRAVFVVGRSQWNGTEIPTAEVFAELGCRWFELVDHLWYPVKNRYMSYSRHNGANIDKEYVLVMKKRGAGARL
jgi:adenine-specific DNA methylase